MIKLTSIELIEINLPLVHFFETSFGRTYERRIILVRVEDADGNDGWGELTCGETPGYSDEWTDSAWETTEKILGPMVVGKDFESAADVWGAMRWVRGHRMSKAGIETACWDLEAKKQGSTITAEITEALTRNMVDHKTRLPDMNFERFSGQGNILN